MSVNKANLRLAVAALRSDRLRQGDGQLKKVITLPDGTTETRYCCLGVFCEVAIANGLDLRVKSEEMGSGAHRVRFDDNGHSLPLRVREFYGLEEDPTVYKDDKGFFGSAVWANDIAGWNFGQIADAFESYYDLGTDNDPLVSQD
jgi:hypothetical protein